ncbi:MAG: molybdopterin-dependent oxidoreductase [Spirochaetes bacterium]|nr:molybdopterin-dependent oxidoreductase [Spirochaetota bacterium]
MPANNLKENFKADKQVIRGSGLIGSMDSGVPTLVDVKDGKIIRIRPLYYEMNYDKKDFNTWKIEARGKTLEPPMKGLVGPVGLTYKKRVYSKNRVRYPLKRADWNPNGERNTQNRGKSGYVRISWDEAADIVASELKRVGKKYGPEAVLSQADMHGETKHLSPSHGCANRLLSLLGGYTIQMRNLDSWEGQNWGAKHVWGCEPVGEMMPAANLYPDIAEHGELLLFWGCDPETTPHPIQGMMSSRLCYWLTELGLKSVYICPDLNYGAAVHADKWIPVLPNTDAALHLAIAYLWITESTYDKEYIASHSYGFEKFEDYVLGKEDGIPKTPAWASEKCGVQEWTIKALARDWAKKVTSLIHGNGGPAIRGPYSSEPARLEAMLLGMQGLGRPGVHQAKMIEWWIWREYYPLPYQGVVNPSIPNFSEQVRPAGSMNQAEMVPLYMGKHPELLKLTELMPNPPKQSIPKCLIHDAILNPPVSWWGLYGFLEPDKEQFKKHTYPAEGCSEIHMIWTDSPCWITCWNDSNSYIKALQSEKIECIVAQHPWMENDCLMADIVLPVATRFEMLDIGADIGSGVLTSVFLEDHCIDPVGESLSDFDAVVKIAEKLGLKEEYTGGKTHEEKQEMSFEGSGVEKLISFKNLKKNKYFVIPCDSGIKDVPPGLRTFFEDPKNNPLTTPTGLLEYSSSALKEHFPDDKERPPVAGWIEKSESHDERLSSKRTEKYPLICMSNHPRWRMHAQGDDIIWTREIPTMKIKGQDGYLYEPVWLNTAEAEARGIKHGDIVKIYNERGTVLGGAYVTERLVPKTAYMDHGARWDPIIPGELDRGGAINTITPHNITSKNATGMVVSGFLVEVEKVTDEEMASWRKDYPEAFNRNYDPVTGVSLSGWLTDEKEGN